MSTELYSDSEESGSESEELTDDDESIEDDEYDEDGTDASDVDIDEDFEHPSNETHSETGDTGDDELYDDKGSNGPRLISKSNESDDDRKANQKSSSSSPQSSSTQHVNVHITENFPNQNNNSSAMQANVSSEVLGDNHVETSLVHKLTDKSPYKSPSSHVQNSTSISDRPESGGRRPTVWGRTPRLRSSGYLVAIRGFWMVIWPLLSLITREALRLISMGMYMLLTGVILL